ncbi:MAG TPA: methylenetetrahydrofolate reductase [Acidimicrobiia bacterium]|jgi:5,10-methylenetetrahydrofolate reductase|nr:methylenetetrahydrofolate reductase [Acidimicrobiia bacterium]
MSDRSFEVVCEIEPPTRPDLMHVRHQIGVLSKVASAFLIPDNHIGRATVSSVAVAHEVEQMGGRSIACLNARDRNLLGFRRDLLTAAAYGVDQFLFVYGDRPSSGARTGQLTVRSMIDELRAFPTEGVRPFRAGVAAGPGPLPAWKRDADFVFAQVRFSMNEMLEWRAQIDFGGPVFAGVMVVPSVSMARKISADIPQLAVPGDWLAAIERDPTAGVSLACDLVENIRASGAFDGVHLIPVSRYREVAARLEGSTR